MPFFITFVASLRILNLGTYSIEREDLYKGELFLFFDVESICFLNCSNIVL